MSEVRLFLVETKIDGASYGSRLPAKSWDHASEMARALNGKVLGDNVHERSAIPAEQLMEFCNAVAEEPIKWKFNAVEQLEAFLSMSWAVRTERFDESDDEG